MSAVSNESMQPAPSAPRLVTPSEAPAVDKQGRGARKLWLVLAAFVLVLGGFLLRLALTADEQSTDDAMIEADVQPLSVRVSGQVLRLHVAENAAVKKGQLIAELDPAELEAKLKQAEGELAAARAQALTAEAEERVAEASARGGLSTAQAQVVTARAQLGSAGEQIEGARADRVHAEVEAAKANADLARARSLLAQGALSQSEVDDASARADAARAALSAASAKLTAAEAGQRAAQGRVAEAGGLVDASAPVSAKIAVAHGSADIARARVLSAEANLELARVMLAYTRITAPADGIVSRITLREGQLVTAGQTFASLVPHRTYVIANYKETQVGHMKPGQRVDIEVDALPDVELHGVVESIAGATGSRFSMLPADNASGNFVKVVQRVPVRIRFDSASLPPALRAGMSVETLVHTN
jgi:membrane fusion protein (multidrug efflux system)